MDPRPPNPEPPREPVSVGPTGVVVLEEPGGMVHITLPSGHGFRLAADAAPTRRDVVDRERLELELAMIRAGVSRFGALVDPRHHAAIAQNLAAMQAAIPREAPAPDPSIQPNGGR